MYVLLNEYMGVDDSVEYVWITMHDNKISTVNHSEACHNINGPGINGPGGPFMTA